MGNGNGIIDPGTPSIITCDECKKAFIGHINVKTIKGIFSAHTCKECQEKKMELFFRYHKNV